MTESPRSPLSQVVREGLERNFTPRNPALLRILEAAESISGQAFVGGGIATWSKQLPYSFLLPTGQGLFVKPPA